MNNWKFWRLLVLLALLAGFAWTLYTRGIVGRFGGTSAELATDYKTEHEWASREIAFDIEEMAAFANRREPKLSATPGLTPWDTDAFTPVAAAAFGDVSPASNDALVVDMYPRLVDLNVTVLVDASKAVSQQLASNMRDPHAHESAALVIGAFALREAADLYSDVRWALNRMTAHLAIARALRHNEAVSNDGALANVLHLALANHQERAMAALSALGTGTPGDPMHAWIRALGMRINSDWRVIAEPAAATRLEKLEYFRARRLTVSRERADKHLREVNEPLVAAFARIAQDSSSLGVEDGGQFVDGALALELEEAALAYQAVHGRAMPASLADALNHRATRLIDGAPQVLPWGAWAEFYQRHIGMNVGMVDSYVRHSLGGHDSANDRKRALDNQLGELTFFPVGTLRRTKGSEGTEADLTYLRQIIDLAATSPELIPVRAWQFAEFGSRYEPLPRVMPAFTSWFAPASSAVPFEAGIRLAKGLRPGADLEAIVKMAPHDATMLIELSKGGEQEPGVGYSRGLLANRHDYDLRAVDATLAAISDVEQRKALLRKGCALSTRDCLLLANALLYNGEEDEAAATYERALADPALDAIARAYDSKWLTMYYFRTRQFDKAKALADEAASTGSGAGYVTRGWLNEQTGDLDAAERDFLDYAERYDYLPPLVAFYYRRVEIEKNAAYQNKWDRWRAELFPNGLQPEPAELAGVPATGVFVNQDSAYSRHAGIRAGDIVVGLEGWRVDSVEQYQAINSFKDDPTVRLTLSRGGRLVKVEAKSPSRLFGTGLQTHPMRGWIKD